MKFMNKRSLLSLVLVFLAFTSYSQEFTLGARGGINTYTIGDINSRGGSIQAGKPDEVFSPTKEFGFQFGAFLDIEFGKLFIRPEINIASFKNKYDFPIKESSWESSNVNIPILVGYEIFNPISVYAGPSFNIYGNTTLDGVQVTSYSDGGPDLEKTNVGITVGAMVRIGRLGIDLRYETISQETQEELLDIDNSGYGINLADLYSYKPSVLSLSVFIDIIKTDKDDIGGFFAGIFKKDKCYCPY